MTLLFNNIIQSLNLLTQYIVISLENATTLLVIKKNVALYVRAKKYKATIICVK
jgi:hypothetical protein